MVFSNLIFLYLFLPLCLAAYFLCRSVPAKNAVLIVFSLIFYAWGEPVYLFLMIAAAAVNWGFGLLIEKRHKRVFLVLALVLDLGCLAVFKYTGFVVENLNALFGASIPVPVIALPIGISFYTFQALSYTVDVWRGDVPAQRSFAKFLLYISLFPQLIAGPIVRYSDIEAELHTRRFCLEDIGTGARRFTVGLGKKVLLANVLGELVSSAGNATVLGAWLGAVGYLLQIYFDFSGYSDMAIGLGRMFGFTFPENFDYPYLARSVTDFWRRWHQTLGQWFRDYVYIPLGGSRTTRAKWIRNVAVVWLLTGLWHGAAWNFVLWGGYFGLLLLAERLWLGRLLARAPAAVQHALLLLLVTLGFVLFRAESLQACGQTLRAMFGGAPLWDADALYALRSFAGVLVLGAVGATRLPKRLWKRLEPHPVSAALGPVLTGLLLLAATAALVDGSFNPFLYFRF